MESLSWKHSCVDFRPSSAATWECALLHKSITACGAIPFTHSEFWACVCTPWHTQLLCCSLGSPEVTSFLAVRSYLTPNLHRRFKGSGEEEGPREGMCASQVSRVQASLFLKVWIESCSITKSCPAVCDPMDCSTPGFPVLHDLLDISLSLAHTHVH